MFPFFSNIAVRIAINRGATDFVIKRIVHVTVDPGSNCAMRFGKQLSTKVESFIVTC